MTWLVWFTHTQRCWRYCPTHNQSTCSQQIILTDQINPNKCVGWRPPGLGPRAVMAVCCTRKWRKVCSGADQTQWLQVLNVKPPKGHMFDVCGVITEALFSERRCDFSHVSEISQKDRIHAALFMMGHDHYDKVTWCPADGAKQPQPAKQHWRV